MKNNNINEINYKKRKKNKKKRKKTIKNNYEVHAKWDLERN